MNWCMGVDPGKSGCLCFLRADRGNHKFYDWPKDVSLETYYAQICSFLSGKQISMCVIEKVHAMPKQGVSSMFSFGMNFGIWQGWIMSWHIPCMQVAPQTWMKGLIHKSDGNTTKKQIAEAAHRMFPDAELYGPMGGYKDGRGDSLLMAYYALLQTPEGCPIERPKTYKSLRRT